MARKGRHVTNRTDAAVLLIGDELLAGRTRDSNLAHIAVALGEIGIPVREARIVADSEAEIVEALDALRGRYAFVFTTGGIGPTHDDITADCVAKAFGVRLVEHPEALARLEAHYGPERFNAARRRMARVPEGAELIDNPVSVAPGFRVGNVFVMAGIPVVMQAMLESVKGSLPGGPAIATHVVLAAGPEGDLAAPLGAIQARYPELAIGSYPSLSGGRIVTRLVARGADASAVAAARDEIAAMVDRLGFTLPG
ncbi:MAG: competence/damage-inducible protein A [Alphaproteobacteria bacterium]|nr:competence/damage-inducible protein A [Alphaproteobacteria bacterium]